MNKELKSIKGTTVIYAMEDPSNPSETEWIESNAYTSSFNEYDSNGNIIKSSSYNHQQEIHEYYEYKYDENGNVSEELCYFDEDELAQQKFITWNEDQLRICEKVIYQEDGSENITYFAYNENHLLIEKRIVDQDDELEELETYEYDNERLITESKFDYDNKPVFTKKYKYDDKGNITVYDFTSSDPYENLRFEYFYDENGNREKILKYNHKDQLVEKNLMHFDEKGNLLETYEETQKSKKTTRFTYDENNNQIKQEECNENELVVISIERTFDNDNKLLESLVFTQDPEDGVQQMYAYKYEYTYREE